MYPKNEILHQFIVLQKQKINYFFKMNNKNIEKKKISTRKGGGDRPHRPPYGSATGRDAVTQPSIWFRSIICGNEFSIISKNVTNLHYKQHEIRRIMLRGTTPPAAIAPLENAMPSS